MAWSVTRQVREGHPLGERRNDRVARESSRGVLVVYNAVAAVAGKAGRALGHEGVVWCGMPVTGASSLYSDATRPQSMLVSSFVTLPGSTSTVFREAAPPHPLRRRIRPRVACPPLLPCLLDHILRLPRGA